MYLGESVTKPVCNRKLISEQYALLSKSRAAEGGSFLVDNILYLFVIGLSYGLVLFLLATGLTLTMGLMRVVNMSHGAMYMIAGYFGVWVFTKSSNWPIPDWAGWIAAIIAAAALAAALGLLLETAFLRRLYKHPAYQVLLTIGIIQIINNIALWIWGGLPKSPPIPGFLFGSVHVGSMDIPISRFFILGFGAVMAVLLWLFQDKTKIGAKVRAGMDNREISETLGMNNKSIFTAVFALGSLIAGLSAMIGGTVTGLDAATTGWDVLLLSIIVVVVGGTGSIQGALLGGVIIGLINAFGVRYFPDLASFTIYLVLIIILLIKPSGLLGRKTDVNRAVEDSQGIGGSSPKQRLSFLWSSEKAGQHGIKMDRRFTAYRFAPYMFALLVLIVLPNFFGAPTQSLITKVLIYALFAVSLDIVMGYTGMRSFGHAAFFGMGGYVVGMLTSMQLDINGNIAFGLAAVKVESFWAVLLITIVVCALLSAIIGYFTLRVSGVHFLLVTMAFGQLLSVGAIKAYSLTGGTDGLGGIRLPNLGFIPMEWWRSNRDTVNLKVYYFVLIIFLICYFLIHHFMKSSYGRALTGVRENEGRMRSLGFNTWALKYMGMILSGVFAGVAGLLWAYTQGAVFPRNLGLETSALPMLMVIMGGGSTLWGPALGAAVITIVQNYANSPALAARWPLILGLLYVLCVMFLRGGISRHLSNFWDWVGSRLFLRDNQTL